jgi:ribosomal protein S18 acetylase RimI-like enzyme
VAESLLQRIERYYDAAPRTAARVERIGPFEVFIKVGSGLSYYARPSLGAKEFAAGDVERVRARQRELDVPESFEWVAETSPRLRAAVEAGGLHVHAHPLQVLEGAVSAGASPAGIDLRLATIDDDLRRIGAVAGLAFAAPGTSVGTEGIAELEAAVQRRAADSVEFERKRLQSGLTVSAVAFLNGEPVGVGSHQPVGSVSEIVGVGTLPAYRRQGIAAALTALLVDDALRRGVTTVFLSAGDDTIARVYERVGFKRIGTACIGEPAATAAVE